MNDPLLIQRILAGLIPHTSGKVLIEEEIYDAVSEIGFINKDEKVKVIKYLHGQIYVIKDDKED